MNEEKILFSLDHFVGQREMDARMALEINDVKDAENNREALIKTLKGLGEHPKVKECIEYLEQNHWSTMHEIDLFDKRYETINPQKIKEVVSDLFKR